VTSRKDEAVAVEPAWGGGVVSQSTVAVKGGTDFSATERETEVAGTAGVNRVDGEAAGLGGGLLEDRKGGVALVGHIQLVVFTWIIDLKLQEFVYSSVVWGSVERKKGFLRQNF
jgi:hypothetical protein